MNDWNGRRRKPWLMRMLVASSALVRAVRTKLQDWPPPARLALLLLVVVLLGSVMGCSTPSVLPENAARNPSMPAVSTPQPLKTYSDSVADSFKKWREMLTGTPATASDFSKAGPSKE